MGQQLQLDNEMRSSLTWRVPPSEQSSFMQALSGPDAVKDAARFCESAAAAGHLDEVGYWAAVLIEIVRDVRPLQPGTPLYDGGSAPAGT